MTLDNISDAMPPEELKEWNEKNLEGRVERSCWQNQQRKNKLVVDLWVTSQNYELIADHKRERLNSWGEWRNAKLPFKRKRRIICTSRCEKKRYLNSSNKNLDELLKNELNHEEPPWRTPVTKGWWDRNEGWKSTVKACDDLDGGSGEKAEEIWTPEKKRWKHLELEFILLEKELRSDISQTWEGLHEPPVGLEKRMN